VIRWFSIASWLLLPTVMFGGYCLLSLLRKGKLSPAQVSSFRAGHAHAGVLLVMSLVYYSNIESTTLPPALQLGACLGLIAGILLQAGGFFWHAFVARNQSATGAHLTSTGAMLLGASLFVLAYGLFIRTR
jgi:hypothetical protein